MRACSSFSSGWSSTTLEKHLLIKPNEGIRRSGKNALLAAGIFGPIGGLMSGFGGGIAFGMIGHIPQWLILAEGFTIIFGVIFAFQFWLLHGMIASIEHYLLHWQLSRLGAIPWNLIEFLDYAAERILLTKIGAGYMFSHRLLLEYFASLPLHLEDSKRPKQRDRDDNSE